MSTLFQLISKGGVSLGETGRFDREFRAMETICREIYRGNDAIIGRVNIIQ